MALKVEVDTNQAINIDERSGNKNGRDWKIRTQSIWVYQPNIKFPIQINFLLQEDIPAYPAGEYYLDLDFAVEQGNFQSLNVNTRKLQLVPASDYKKQILNK
jgi:hypothetical protein